jgi:HEAT repeats
MRLLYSRHWSKIAGLLGVVAMSCILGTVYAVSTLFSQISDPFVRYALTFVSVQIALLLFLSSGLIVWKQISIRRSRTKDSTLNGLRNLLAQYAVGEEVTQILLQKAGTHPSEFLDVIENSLHILKGSTQKRVEQLLKLSDAYRNLLSETVNRDPNRALKAISSLRKVNNSDSQAAIERALSHKAPIVQMAARAALLSGQAEHAQWKVLKDLPHLAFWHRVVLFHQIPSDSPVLTQFLSEALSSQQEEMTLTALEFIIGRQRLLAITNNHRLAGSTNLEIRIKYFKALPFFPTDTQTTPLLRSGLADPDWRVRAMAARACGLLGMNSLVPQLLECIGASRTSAEASHAARALAAMGAEARRSLQALCSSGSEMIHRIITEVIEREMLLGTETAP